MLEILSQRQWHAFGHATEHDRRTWNAKRWIRLDPLEDVLRTQAPIFAGRSPATSSGSLRTPERPARRRDQDASTSAARGVTAPMPVTTIRRIYSPTIWVRRQRCAVVANIRKRSPLASPPLMQCAVTPARVILSSGDGLANLFGRRIQKCLSEIGVVDDAR
jgi:hypothetical protein